MESDLALFHDSSVVFADEPQLPHKGWVSRCAGIPFEIPGGGSVFELRRELMRRRLLWLASCDLELDDETTQRLFQVDGDEFGRLRLLWRPQTTLEKILRAAPVEPVRHEVRSTQTFTNVSPGSAGMKRMMASR